VVQVVAGVRVTLYPGAGAAQFAAVDHHRDVHGHLVEVPGVVAVQVRHDHPGEVAWGQTVGVELLLELLSGGHCPAGAEHVRVAVSGVDEDGGARTD